MKENILWELQKMGAEIKVYTAVGFRQGYIDGYIQAYSELMPEECPDEEDLTETGLMDVLDKQVEEAKKEIIKIYKEGK